jgi:hypothetical protein
MKKRNLVIIALIFISIISLNAQTFKKDNFVGNLTIGFGNALYGSAYSSSFPPIAISGDYGIVDNVFDKGTIGIGGLIGYTSSKQNIYSDYSWSYTSIVIGPRGTIHYPFVDKLDTYAGLMIGYDIVSASSTGYNDGYNYTASGSVAIFAGFVGARYYFNDKIAGVCELGFGIAYFNIGISYKIK